MPEPAAIDRLVPHAGRMCLLDRIETWDESAVRCVATSHRSPDNPLRRGGALAAVHAIEYASQAAAVHRALVSPTHRGVDRAVLAKVEDIALRVARLDEVAAPLAVEARRVLSFGAGAVYEFAVSALGRALCDGRLFVVEPAPGR